jgi:hypothetical protein
MAEKANIAVKLDPGIRERLQALGQAKRRSPHWLMVEAIRLYVEREEKIEALPRGDAGAPRLLRRDRRVHRRRGRAGVAQNVGRAE